LIDYVTNAKNGHKVIAVGYLQVDGRQNLKAALNIAEKAFIRHFVTAGHDLHNTRGTKIQRHEVLSSGPKHRGVIPPTLRVEKER
jgi:hypothetical protein